MATGASGKAGGPPARGAPGEPPRAPRDGVDAGRIRRSPRKFRVLTDVGMIGASVRMKSCLLKWVGPAGAADCCAIAGSRRALLDRG